LTSDTGAPSVTQVINGTDTGSDTGAAFGVQNVTAVGEQTVEIAGLSVGTQYYPYLVHEDAAFNQSSVARGSGFTTEIDSTPPVLSGPVETTLSDTTAEISVVSDKNDGDWYWVISESPNTPTAVQIEAELDQLGNAAVVAGNAVIFFPDPTEPGDPEPDTAVQTASVVGLTAETTYYAHFSQKDTSGNRSTPVSGSGFTTDVAADTTEPVLTLPTATTTGSSTADLTVTTDEGNGILYWVVTTRATAPTATQVKAGQDDLGATATAFNPAIDVIATGLYEINVGGLASSTTYYAYFMHEDDSGNQSLVADAGGFTTDADSTGPTLSAQTDVAYSETEAKIRPPLPGLQRHRSRPVRTILALRQRMQAP
jgi:hypothetical protein